MPTNEPKPVKRVTNTEELLAVLKPLSRFERAVYEVLLNNLYAEPGFSDVTATVLAYQLKCSMDMINKTLNILVDLGLIYMEEWDTIDNPKQTFIHAYEHDDEIAR